MGTGNRGWTRIRRLIPRRSRRSIRRWKAFARQLYLSTTVLVVAVEAKVAAMKMRRKRTTSCRTSFEYMYSFFAYVRFCVCVCVCVCERGLTAFAPIGINQGDLSKDFIAYS